MKAPNIQFHGNPSGGSCAAKCRETDRWDITTLIYNFCNYANTIKNINFYSRFFALAKLQTYHSK
jgi:hypothetical protein